MIEIVDVFFPTIKWIQFWYEPIHLYNPLRYNQVIDFLTEIYICLQVNIYLYWYQKDSWKHVYLILFIFHVCKFWRWKNKKFITNAYCEKYLCHSLTINGTCTYFMIAHVYISLWLLKHLKRFHASDVDLDVEVLPIFFRHFDESPTTDIETKTTKDRNVIMKECKLREDPWALMVTWVWQTLHWLDSYLHI